MNENNEMNQQPQQPQQPQQAPNGQGGLLSFADDLSPQQIEQMKKGFQVAQQIMYDEQVFAGMMKEVQQSAPAEALASVVTQVIMKIQEGLGQIDFPVLLALGIKIIDDLADAINQTGQMQIGEEDIAQAMQMAVQMYLSANHGKFDPAEIQNLTNQLSGGA